MCNKIHLCYNLFSYLKTRRVRNLIHDVFSFPRKFSLMSTTLDALVGGNWVDIDNSAISATLERVLNEN